MTKLTRELSVVVLIPYLVKCALLHHIVVLLDPRMRCIPHLQPNQLFLDFKNCSTLVKKLWPLEYQTCSQMKILAQNSPFLYTAIVYNVMFWKENMRWSFLARVGCVKHVWIEIDILILSLLFFFCFLFFRSLPHFFLFLG